MVIRLLDSRLLSTQLNSTQLDSIHTMYQWDRMGWDGMGWDEYANAGMNSMILVAFFKSLNWAKDMTTVSKNFVFVVVVFVFRFWMFDSIYR